MDKRQLLAIVLSFIILGLWMMFFGPRPLPPAAPGAAGGAGTQSASGPLEPGPAAGTAAPGGEVSGAQETSPAAGAMAEGEGAATPGTDAASGAAGAPGAPKREAPVDALPVIVETDLARIEFSNPGGRVTSWTLKAHKDYEGRPYELVSPDAHRAASYPFQLRLSDKALEGILNGRARFDVERGPAPDSEGAGVETVRLIWADGQGVEAVKSFTFHKDSYLARMAMRVTRNGQLLQGQVVWGPGIGTPTRDDLQNSYFEGGRAIAAYGRSAERVSARSLSAPRLIDGQPLWAGIEEQYFAAVFIPTDGLGGAEIVPTLVPPADVPVSSTASGAKPEPPKPVNRLSVAVPIGQEYTFFAGPKDFQLLSGLGRNLSDLVNFAPGVPLLGPLVGALAKLLYAALRWLHSVIPNFGVGIIILTTIIRILFYPLTQRTMVKMRAVQQQMQKVQPKIKAIREKYRKMKDASARGKMNEEIMAVYQREGINPMASLGGCLPLLLQLPILYAFYSVLTVTIDLRQAPFFGWIGDLSQKDPYYITPIVMGVSMFVQQKMSMTNTTDPQARSQQRMMLIMPFIFTYTFLYLPSGLVLYWFVNNILGIVQQVLINKQAAALEAQAVEGRA